MRWTTFRSPESAVDRVGLVVGEDIHALETGLALLDLLGDDGTLLAEAGERARANPVDVVSLNEVSLRAPIPSPPTFRDFYAFEQHVRTARQRRGLEMDPLWYQLPVFYFSNPYAIVGPDDAVAVPPGTKQLDYELEVVAVVGRGGSNLTPKEAESRIAGFMVMNDWSARDLQREEMRLSMGPVKGKGFRNHYWPLLRHT